MQNETPVFLTGPEVLKRYRITNVTLWRWESDTSVGFPKPMKVSGRRKLYRLSQLEAWEATQAAKSEGEAA